MAIWQIAYRSDTFKVKGYLGLPESLPYATADIGRELEQAGGLPGPVTETACNLAEGMPPGMRARTQKGKKLRGTETGMSPGAAWTDAWTDARTDAWNDARIAFRTDAAAPARLPAVVYCRGGIGNFGKVRLHWVEAIARQGFVVLAPCYRGCEGGEGRDEFGGGDREDVHAAYRILRRLPFVHPDRVSLLGFSRGAINAALTAAETGTAHRLVLWGGVADLARTYEERVDLRRTLKRIVGGSPAKRPEAYRDRSPLLLAERLRCPVLLMHGTEDAQVSFAHSRLMSDRFQALSRPADMHVYEGYGHLLPYAVHEAAVERMCAWLHGDVGAPADRELQ